MNKIKKILFVIILFISTIYAFADKYTPSSISLTMDIEYMCVTYDYDKPAYIYWPFGMDIAEVRKVENLQSANEMMKQFIKESPHCFKSFKYTKICENDDGTFNINYKLTRWVD